MIPIRDTAQGATFALKVHPRAKKTAITGILGDGEGAALKVSLSTPPVDGRANDALIEFFSTLFAIPRSAVSVLSGEHSRTKVVRIAGRTSEEVKQLLAASL